MFRGAEGGIRVAHKNDSCRTAESGTMEERKRKHCCSGSTGQTRARCN